MARSCAQFEFYNLYNGEKREILKQTLILELIALNLKSGALFNPDKMNNFLSKT